MVKTFSHYAYILLYAFCRDSSSFSYPSPQSESKSHKLLVVDLLFVAIVSDFADKQLVSVATEPKHPCMNKWLPITKVPENAT